MTIQSNIRNFAIISHIDHGKSTLADRLLELTGTIPPLKMRDRVLDNMELEREKGITIKLKAVRMVYKSIVSRESHPPRDTSEVSADLSAEALAEVDFTSEVEESAGESMGVDRNLFILNLIDTPGHVDFSYEVSRSLAACEGALLLVDATQGIQAQTLANVYKAQGLRLKIIPIINKIDLPNAEPEKAAQDLVETLGFKKGEILFISAKTGKNVAAVLEAVIERIPPPAGYVQFPLRALVFDSAYDLHKGVLAFVRIVDGKIAVDSGKIAFLATKAICEPLEIGVFSPEMQKAEELSAGEVGYIATGLKDLLKVRVGDTITKLKIKSERLKVKPLPDYKEVKPVVFTGFFPLDSNKYIGLREALAKLHLTDASFTYEPETNTALGNGFRCGFLGLLHLEIIRERLEREYDLELISTAPSVVYEIKLKMKNEKLKIKNVEELPDGAQIEEILEPWVEVIIYTPQDYSSRVLDLLREKRGFLVGQDYLGGALSHLKLNCEMPLAEMIVDFYNRLKSISSGFASLDWEFLGYRSIKAVRLDIFVNREIVPPLSSITVENRAAEKGRELVQKLKKILPRQQFAVPVQAAIGGKILARETIPAMRKNVTAKLYGGDRTRKDKLLKKQKEGKKRLAKIGKIQIPQEAFRAVLEA